MNRTIRAGLAVALAATLGGASSSVAFPQVPAFAATQRTVYVQTSGIPSTWDVTGAMKFVDQYTGRTHFVRAVCPVRRDCITIKNGTIKTSEVGLTYPATSHTAYEGWFGDSTKVTWFTQTIVIDTRKASARGYTSYLRKWLVAHELGHTRGLGHQRYSISVMYPYTRPKPPMYFTYAERRTLAGK